MLEKVTSQKLRVCILVCQTISRGLSPYKKYANGMAMKARREALVARAPLSLAGIVTGAAPVELGATVLEARVDL